MKTWRVDYYRGNRCTYKIIEAETGDIAAKKAKIKNIREITDITGKTYNAELRQYIQA